MALYGYARVSTTEQDLTAQRDTLRAAGCEVIREEKRSGSSREGRAELDTLLAFLRPGDCLLVTRIDRLARSIGDLQDIVRQLRAKQVALRATEQPIDTSTAAGKAFLDMLGVFAEFETNLRRERQMEGIARAKVRGVYKGRKAGIERSKVHELHAQGMGASAIAASLNIGRASVYRLLQSADHTVVPVIADTESEDGSDQTLATASAVLPTALDADPLAGENTLKSKSTYGLEAELGNWNEAELDQWVIDGCPKD